MNAGKTLTLSAALLRGEPYFGMQQAAYQGGIERKACMIALLDRVIDECSERPIKVLEVGSWAGGSAVTWALGIKQRGVSGRVLCVDHWQPYLNLSANTAEHYAEMTRAAETGDIYRLFLHNLRATGVADIVDHMKGRAEDILPTLDSEAYDLIFLDGSHSYEEIRTDLAHAGRLLRIGGILSGDDLELRLTEVDEAAHRLAIGKDVDFAVDPRSGRSYHPGVTQAVAEAFEEVSEWHGVWFVAKCQDTWKTLDIQPDIAAVPRALAEIEPPEEEPPRLIAVIGDVNVVQYRDNVFALPQHLGEVSLNDGAQVIKERYHDEVEISDSGLGLIATILGERIAKVQAAISSSRATYEEQQAALRSLIDATQAAAEQRGASLDATLQALEMRLQELHSTIEPMRADSEQRGASLDATLQALEMRFQELRSTIETVQADSEQRTSSVEMTLRALCAELEALRNEAGDRLDATVARVTTLELEMREVRLACDDVLLLGEYRGFNIVVYAGHVFGLRQSLGEVNVRDGAATLIERHGAQNVVVAWSPDGARARVDMLALVAQLNALALKVQSIQTSRAGRLLRLGS